MYQDPVKDTQFCDEKWWRIVDSELVVQKIPLGHVALAGMGG